MEQGASSRCRSTRYGGRHLAGAGISKPADGHDFIVEWRAASCAFSIAAGYHGLTTNRTGAPSSGSTDPSPAIRLVVGGRRLRRAPAGGRRALTRPNHIAGVAHWRGGGHPVGAGTRHGRLPAGAKPAASAHRMQRLRRTEHLLEAPCQSMAAGVDVAAAPRSTPCLTSASSINGFRPSAVTAPCSAIQGAPLMNRKLDCRAALDTLIADIEQARASVHRLLHLAGRRRRRPYRRYRRAAAQRGVQCRVMVDDGSRALVHPRARLGSNSATPASGCWRSVGNPRWRYRFSAPTCAPSQIVVIDNRHHPIAAARTAPIRNSRVKPEFAPWIDILLRPRRADRAPAARPCS